MIADPLVVVPVEPFVAAVSALKLFVVHVTRERHPRDHEVIVAENLAESFDDVSIEPADRRSHRNHRRHADDDADQRQKRAQFVREDRLQSDLQGIGIKRQKSSHRSWEGRGVRVAIRAKKP